MTRPLFTLCGALACAALALAGCEDDGFDEPPAGWPPPEEEGAYASQGYPPQGTAYPTAAPYAPAPPGAPPQGSAPTQNAPMQGSGAPQAAPPQGAASLPQGGGRCGDPGADYLLAAWEGQVILPLTQMSPGPDWVPFSNPSVSYVFFHPRGWQATPIAQIGEATRTTGFQLIGPDGAALAMVSGFNVPQTTPRDVAWEGVTRFIGGGQVLCVQDHQIPGAMPATESLVVAANGGLIALTVGRVTVETSMGVTMTDLTVYAGPRQAFAHLVGQVYLPILAQMRSGGGGCTPDGVADGDDDDGDGDPNDDDEC